MHQKGLASLVEGEVPAGPHPEEKYHDLYMIMWHENDGKLVFWA